MTGLLRRLLRLGASVQGRDRRVSEGGGAPPPPPPRGGGRRWWGWGHEEPFLFVLAAMLYGVYVLLRPLHAPEPPPPAPDRYPFAAAVLLLEDATPDLGTLVTTSGVTQTFEDGLTRSSSYWRPRLTMPAMSAALAEALRLRLTQESFVVDDRRSLKGARLLVEGKVVRASWTRGDGNRGSYRFIVHLAAFAVRPDGTEAPVWRKSQTEDFPARGSAAKEVPAAVQRMFTAGIDDLAQAMKKEPAGRR